MNFCQVSALTMLYGGFREISKFWHFFSNFLHGLFKNHVKRQILWLKKYPYNMSDVKFYAEHDPAVRKNKKNLGKP